MIAAIYARKSTEQTGTAEEAKSVTRQIDTPARMRPRRGGPLPRPTSTSTMGSAAQNSRGAPGSSG
jgi:hypothetical protein